MEMHLSSAECMLVRETMVRQERVYREQVQALHYLYQVQKTLMEEHVAKRSSCWDVSNNSRSPDPVKKPPDGSPGFQFFPTRDEAPPVDRPPPPRRFLFDLEKLPDECLEPELESEPEPGGAGLALHSPFMDTTSSSSRPQASGGAPELQSYQPHWLQESSWRPSTSYSQLGNSWLQLASQGSTRSEQHLQQQQQQHGVSWYAQHSTPSSASHPWQASGASYFPQEPYFPRGASLGSLLSSGLLGASSWQGNPAMKTPGFYQQEEDRYQRNGLVNGYGNPLLDYLVSSETPPQHGNSWKSSFGDRNFYRESVNTMHQRNSGAPAELQINLYAGQRARSRGEKLSSFEAELPLLQKETGSEQVAASVLLSFGLDKGYSPKENSPGALKKSVEWFADAIPVEVSEEEKKTIEETIDVSQEEVDQFEAEMLLVKESLFEEHAPLNLEVEEMPASPPRSNKGRPSRVCKRKRDFRSTLPSITSLSRQEINEDIQMMSGLLRSTRELKGDRRGSSGKACSRTKNSTSPVSTLDMNKVPWLVSWGVATRRKRKKRQRVSHKAGKGSASSGLSVFSSVINIKMQ